MIIICSILLFTNVLNDAFNIRWFVYAQTAAYVLTAIITFLVVLQKSGKIRLRFNLKFFLVFLRKSYPYALLILLMSLYNRIDSVLLERLLPGTLGHEQAGIYAQAFRLLDAVSMFGVLFAGLLLPIFSKMLKQRENVGQMVKLAYTLLIVPAIIIAVSSVYYDGEIMALLYTSNTAYSSDILGLLMIGFIGIATTYIFGTLLTANGSLRLLNMMAFAGMVLNVVLNFVLIPKFMAYGSAYASLTTQLFTGAAQLVLALYLFKLKPGITYGLQLLIFTGVVVALATVTQNLENWIHGYLLTIVASFAFAFIIKLISVKDMFKILLYR
jgi:O-antigen/teichoic acid export membrane protein